MGKGVASRAIGVALAQFTKPSRVKSLGVIFRYHRSEGTVLCSGKAYVVADRADEFAANDDLRRLLPLITLPAVKLLRQIVMFHIGKAQIAKRGNPGPASSMLKVRATEVQVAISELAMRAIAYYAAPHQPEERLAGANLEPIGLRDEMSITARYLNDRAASIYAGSNEIQRNIMAKMVLGM